jgi:diacylglycerol kinase (ATP)
MYLQQDHFFVIINPTSGGGKALTDWSVIERLLIKNQFSFKYTFSSYVGHIKELVSEKIISGYRKFIIVGGDGSINETINGILSQQLVDSKLIYAGVIPVGTGNDFCRMHNIPSFYPAAIKIIKAGKSVLHDAGEIKSLRDNKITYFINIAGCGFDGFVVEKINSLHSDKKSNKIFYLLKVLQYLFRYKPVSVKVMVHGSLLYDGNIFSMTIANCKFNGGGMIPAPEARFDDGLLNITIIKPMNLLRVIFNLYRLFTGNITKHSQVIAAKVSSVKIEGNPNNLFESDGEIAGAGSYEIKVLPHAVNIFTAKG